VSGAPPSLEALADLAAARWGDRVVTRVSFDRRSRKYIGVALRLTATGPGAEEVCASVDHATAAAALHGLRDAIDGNTSKSSNGSTGGAS
jgi:alkaline phosphatase